MYARPQKVNQKGSLTSLVLTGDLWGIPYIKETANDVPKKTFNFCCTVDGTNDRDTNLMAQRPQRRDDYEQQRQQRLLEQQREEQERIRREQLE